MPRLKSAPKFVCDVPNWKTSKSARRRAAAIGRAAQSAADPSARPRNATRFANALAYSQIEWPDPDLANFATLHSRTPDIEFVRKVYVNGNFTMHDGRQVDHWGFEDENGVRALPSTPIVVTQGQLVHVHLATRRGVHTIHHHGIEPDSRNDGVGHASFEPDAYTYQWLAAHPGSYFYHCHVNTALHVQMGLFGGLIVYPKSGPGRSFEGGPEYSQERYFVGYGVDHRWHELNHFAGRDGVAGTAADGSFVQLNQLVPEYNFISHLQNPDHLMDPDFDGVGADGVSSGPIAIRCSVGETILLRLLDANYHPLRWTFPMDAEFIAADGRPLACTFTDRTITHTAAQRYEVLLRPDKPGDYRIRCETLHWVTKKVIGVTETQIVVTGSAGAARGSANECRVDGGGVAVPDSGSSVPSGVTDSGNVRRIVRRKRIRRRRRRLPSRRRRTATTKRRTTTTR